MKVLNIIIPVYILSTWENSSVGEILDPLVFDALGLNGLMSKLYKYI